MNNPGDLAAGLVDAHAHLGAEEFAADLEAVLERATAARVQRIVVVGETLEDARRNLDLARRYPIVKPCAGLHPEILDRTAADDMIEFIRGHHTGLVGIGEVGLDYWLAKEEPQRHLQREIFGRFVELSLELDLPLNVHSRSAGRHTIGFLGDRGARRVLLHAFDGKAGAADAALELGYYFSVPPSIVRSRQKEKLVKRLPLERLLLETDAPVLGPDPQARNEPANARVALEAVAKIKGISPAEVAKRTTENAAALFPGLFDVRNCPNP